MKFLAATTIVIALAAAALLGGVVGEDGASAGRSIEAERAATRGLTLQQQARVSGNPALYPRAERALDKALRLDPRSGQALRGLSALAASRHRFSESLALARRAQAIEPHVAAVYGLIGDANLELGRYREAFAAFDKMTALKPSASSYARISYARELKGDARGSLEAIELAVDAATVGEPAAWTRTLAGNRLLADQRPAAAKLRFREALSYVPGYPGALSGLAEIRAANGDLEGARALYARAASAAPVPEFAESLGDTSPSSVATLRQSAPGSAPRSWSGCSPRTAAATCSRRPSSTSTTTATSVPLSTERVAAVRSARASRAITCSPGRSTRTTGVPKRGRCRSARSGSGRSTSTGSTTTA